MIDKNRVCLFNRKSTFYFNVLQFYRYDRNIFLKSIIELCEMRICCIIAWCISRYRFSAHIGEKPANSLEEAAPSPTSSLAPQPYTRHEELPLPPSAEEEGDRTEGEDVEVPPDTGNDRSGRRRNEGRNDRTRPNRRGRERSGSGKNNDSSIKYMSILTEIFFGLHM